ncbi:MAG: diacylglycerol kinase family protein [Thermoanaerobaculia bacterium]
MKPQGILFLNPRAGTFAEADEASLRSAAAEAGLRVVEIVPDVDVHRAIREGLDAGLRKFVVAGGDGSLHHAVQALVHTEGVLGVLPAGSVNHFARDLEIPVDDWRAAFDVAIGGEVRQIDVGRINNSYFLNSVMLGLYPAISHYRERFRSVHSRTLAYLKASRFAMHQFPHVTLVVEMDGRVETFRTQMFVVAVNAYDLTQTGLVSPKTTFTDGRLSIYTLSFMNRVQFVRAAAQYLRGKIGEVTGFRRIRTHQLRVDTGRHHMKIAVDGELLDIQPPFQIAAVPAGLLVRVPRQAAVAAS